MYLPGQNRDAGRLWHLDPACSDQISLDGARPLMVQRAQEATAQIRDAAETGK